MKWTKMTQMQRQLWYVLERKLQHKYDIARHLCTVSVVTIS